MWLAYPRRVQRSDLLRLLLVAHFGGLYVDLDVRPRSRPLDELWAMQPSASTLHFEEIVLSPDNALAVARDRPIRGGRPEECQRIANFAFASDRVKPPLRDEVSLALGSDSGPLSLFQRVLSLMLSRAALPVHSDYDVLYSTGPAALTEAVHAYAYAMATAANNGSNVKAPFRATATAQVCDTPASELLERAAGMTMGVSILRKADAERYLGHLLTNTWKNAGDAA